MKLSLPLAEQSVVDMPHMHVRYNWLPLLLLFGPGHPRGRLDRPVLHVWQSADGRWNLAEVMELMGRAGGKKAGQQPAQAAPAAPRRSCPSW